MPPRIRKNFFNFSPKAKLFDQLLDKEDVTIAEILEQDVLSTSITNTSYPKLFDFLNQQKNMEELLKWSLTDEYTDHLNYLKLSNASVTVFVSCSKTFLNMIIENPTFCEKFKEITTSKPPSTHCCGNFLKITESMVNSTNGSFLIQIPNLSNFLIENITVIPLKILFVSVSCGFPEQFGFNTDLLIKLIKTMNEENCIFIVSLLREIIENQSELKTAVFDSSDVIDRLFSFAIEELDKNPLYSAEIFRLLLNFKELESYKEVLHKYSENFEYKLNLSLPFQISNFQKLTPQIFDLFFIQTTCSLIVEAIYLSFREKSLFERRELTKSCNLRQKIIENFGKSRTNGRIAELAFEIRNDFEGEDDNDQSFSSFVEQKIVPHLKLASDKYGGEIMNSDEDDDVVTSGNEQVSNQNDDVTTVKNNDEMKPLNDEEVKPSEDEPKTQLSDESLIINQNHETTTVQNEDDKKDQSE